MNFSNEARLAHGAAANGSPTFGLPLVSVIVVNYNYGRFLRQTVDFVFAQNYPNIECIIVDNASTDDSSEIITDLAKRYPDITILRRADNAGLCIAATEGFEFERRRLCHFPGCRRRFARLMCRNAYFCALVASHCCGRNVRRYDLSGGNASCARHLFESDRIHAIRKRRQGGSFAAH